MATSSNIDPMMLVRNVHLMYISCTSKDAAITIFYIVSFATPMALAGDIHLMCVPCTSKDFAGTLGHAITLC